MGIFQCTLLSVSQFALFEPTATQFVSLINVMRTVWRCWCTREEDERKKRHLQWEVVKQVTPTCLILTEITPVRLAMVAHAILVFLYGNLPIPGDFEPFSCTILFMFRDSTVLKVPHRLSELVMRAMSDGPNFLLCRFLELKKLDLTELISLICCPCEKGTLAL